MNFSHQHIESWGIKPVLFHIGAWGVPSYSFFVLLGLITGGIVYYFEARRYRSVNEYSLLIAIGALVGASLGAKLLELLVNIDKVVSTQAFWVFVVSGRTIIGGLIGGTLGSMIVKKALHIKTRKGNLFAPAIALGVAVGRVGCFLTGCCYGKPSTLPWAVDFGDGVLRHPTQLYESVFMLAMFFFLKIYYRKKDIRPGYLFKVSMIAYFVFRFAVEFIREERIAFGCLSFFQVIALFVLLYLCFDDIALFIKQKIRYGDNTDR